MLLASAFSRADDVTCATTSGGGGSGGSSLLTTNDVTRAAATGGSGGSGGGGITQAELARALGLAQSSDAAVIAASPEPGWPALSCEYLEEQWRRVDTNFEVQVPKYNKPKNTTGKWYDHATHVHCTCTLY